MKNQLLITITIILKKITITITTKKNNNNINEITLKKLSQVTREFVMTNI